MGPTDDVDHTARDDGPLAANDVGDIASNECTEEGSAGEDGNDERLMRRLQLGGVWAFNTLVELSQAEDTVDVSRIVTEEDTAERCEGADEVRLPGHGSLDARDIAGGCEGSAAGHGGECAIDVVELKTIEVRLMCTLSRRGR